MPLSNFLIAKILKQIRLLDLYDEDDIDMIRYSLQAILWEIEKIIILLLLFTWMGRPDYFLITLLAVISIRMIAGGYHSQTSLNCLIITFIGFFLAIIALPLIPLNNFGLFALFGFSLLVTWLAAPIRSIEKEAIQNTEKDRQKKITATIITSIWFFGIAIYKMHPYAHPILWIIVLQNAQLLFEYIRRKKYTRP